MSNSVLLSAVTIIALTGITLTTLKYRHDDNSADLHDNNVDFDYEDFENATEARVNPKFNLHAKNHSTAKRSVGDNVQYSIADTDLSMIDEAKRDKVKQVQLSSRSAK